MKMGRQSSGGRWGVKACRFVDSVSWFESRRWECGNISFGLSQQIITTRPTHEAYKAVWTEKEIGVLQLLEGGDENLSLHENEFTG
jgi:hypothetical protein